MTTENIQQVPPTTTFALIQELVYRDGLQSALAGRDDVLLEPILRLLLKYVTDPRFGGLACDVAGLIIGTSSSSTTSVTTVALYALYRDVYPRSSPVPYHRFPLPTPAEKTCSRVAASKRPCQDEGSTRHAVHIRGTLCMMSHMHSDKKYDNTNNISNSPRKLLDAVISRVVTCPRRRSIHPRRCCHGKSEVSRQCPGTTCFAGSTSAAHDRESRFPVRNARHSNRIAPTPSSSMIIHAKM